MEKYLDQIFRTAITSFLLEQGMEMNNITVLFRYNDIITTKFADYQYNGTNRIFRGLDSFLRESVSGGTTTLNYIGQSIVDRVLKLLAHNPVKIVQKIVHDKNFINITIDNAFILKTVIDYGKHLVVNGPIPYDMLGFGSDMFGFKSDDIVPSSFKKIIVDYSSPNVAKSLHIGHLRSTMIGETIVRLLKNAGHDVIGLNHIGDWGTQFGMIINYIKIKHNQSPIDLELLNSNDLMEIYRNAKKLFDTDKIFANESREQTYKLQQGDEHNTAIWRTICKISSVEYSNIYKLLNIKHLTERGESFYQSIIPEVLKILKDKDLLILNDGATIIQFEGWEFPLMMIKSDGGYTYDTTDIAALYHRLCVMDVDSVIYVTDSGQKSHFDKCFDVANRMGWTKTGTRIKTLTHIGFGLVLGKDGTKLKTRSGDVVKMLDVIDEVIGLSAKIINDRIEKCCNSTDTDPTSVYYQNISDHDKIIMSQRIGINNLKYFDLTHRYETNYRYDPELMFRFNGDTGVYLMYCFARINGIIEKCTINKSTINKSTINIDLHDIQSMISMFDLLDLNVDQSYFTKETRELLLHIMNFGEYMDRAVENLNSVELTKYIYLLCTYFNTFISQKGRKIIGSQNETLGIVLCIIVSKIIEYVFDLLSFEPVAHI